MIKAQALSLEVEFWRLLTDKNNYYHDSKSDTFQINYDRIVLNNPEMSTFRLRSPLCTQYLNSMCIGCTINCSNKYGTENYSDYQNFYNAKSLRAKIKNSDKIYKRLSADLMKEIEITKMNSKGLMNNE